MKHYVKTAMLLMIACTALIISTLILNHAKAQTAPPTITIASVVGLANALNLRPQMGISYQAGRAVVIDQSGQLSAATGTLSDCIQVDGVSGPCAGSGASSNFADSETPGGALNGSNLTFTVQVAPNPSNSLKLYRNGVRLMGGSDFRIVNNVITLITATAPLSGDILVADYRY
jgi:hypothetical protein